jgi:hypothetical protein
MSIHALIQYVNDPRPARQAEYEECVRRNLANPHVELVHDLQEAPGVVVPDEFADHPKFRRYPLGKWLTFRDAFDYANAQLSGEPCCLMNLDIFLDPNLDWSLVCAPLRQRIVFCLSRTEFNADQTSYRDPDLMTWAFANSQDAWLFMPPVQIDGCDFELGTLGCDNAIAHRVRQAGYRPVNAPQQFRIFHYDRARGKTLENQQAIYDAERQQQQGRGTHPERQGHYLLPDFDMIKSVDQLLDTFKASELDRYSIICDVFSKFIKLSNP